MENLSVCVRTVADLVVVLQDEALMGVEQPGGADDPGEVAQGVNTFHRIPPDPLQPSTLISPTSVSMAAMFEERNIVSFTFYFTIGIMSYFCIDLHISRNLPALLT